MEPFSNERTLNLRFANTNNPLCCFHILLHTHKYDRFRCHYSFQRYIVKAVIKSELLHIEVSLESKIALEVKNAIS